ncbi:hypothetical protein [Cohnella algarum]|uniref:hypothetical protein n=1 Tax=Cohnella algarum TaxID=2044859 RepID=UPI0019680A76|nr:hypothetical protein [Cohnella algarum]MBN2980710.1 hypothetical protein [Cohnella algarum]
MGHFYSNAYGRVRLAGQDESPRLKWIGSKRSEAAKWVIFTQLRMAVCVWRVKMSRHDSNGLAAWCGGGEMSHFYSNAYGCVCMAGRDESPRLNWIGSKRADAVK